MNNEKERRRKIKTGISFFLRLVPPSLSLVLFYLDRSIGGSQTAFLYTHQEGKLRIKG